MDRRRSGCGWPVDWRILYLSSYDPRQRRRAGRSLSLAVPAKPALPEEPAVKHPLPEPEKQEPLPPLDESDEAMQNVLAGVIGKEFVQQFIVPKDLVRHVVVTIDNLTDREGGRTDSPRETDTRQICGPRFGGGARAGSG